MKMRSQSQHSLRPPFLVGAWLALACWMVLGLFGLSTAHLESHAHSESGAPHLCLVCHLAAHPTPLEAPVDANSLVQTREFVAFLSFASSEAAPRAAFALAPLSRGPPLFF